MSTPKPKGWVLSLRMLGILIVILFIAKMLGCTGNEGDGPEGWEIIDQHYPRD